MSTAKPVRAPQSAVTARPRNGSSIRMAISAPATAPKKEAAQARNGVSSQPKIRKRSRSQRIASAAPGPQERERGGEGEPGKEGHSEGRKRPPRAGEPDQDRHDRREHGKGDRRSERRRDRYPPVPLQLVGQNP